MSRKSNRLKSRVGVLEKLVAKRTAQVKAYGDALGQLRQTLGREMEKNAKAQKSIRKLNDELVTALRASMKVRVQIDPINREATIIAMTRGELISQTMCRFEETDQRFVDAYMRATEEVMEEGQRIHTIRYLAERLASFIMEAYLKELSLGLGGKR